MPKKLYDLAVKTGEYQDGQGQTKGRWLNVGAVMQSDDGGAFLMLHKTFNPAGVPDLSGKGGDSVLISCFQSQQSGGQQQNQQQGYQQQRQAPNQQPPQQGGFNDDPPF